MKVMVKCTFIWKKTDLFKHIIFDNMNHPVKKNPATMHINISDISVFYVGLMVNNIKNKEI